MEISQIVLDANSIYNSRELYYQDQDLVKDILMDLKKVNIDESFPLEKRNNLKQEYISKFPSQGTQGGKE